MEVVILMILLAGAVVDGDVTVANCIDVDPFSICNFNTSKVILSQFWRGSSHYNEVCDYLDDFYDCCLINKDKLTAICVLSPLFKTFLNSKFLMYRLCEKTGNQFQYQRDFFKFMHCFRERWDDLRICQSKSEDMYSIYQSIVQVLTLFGDEDVPEGFRTCMKMKYRLDCLSHKMLLSCGASAKRVFDHFLHESQYLDLYCEPFEYEDAKKALNVVNKLMKQMNPPGNATAHNFAKMANMFDPTTVVSDAVYF